MRDGGADFIVAEGPLRLVIEVKQSADTAAIGGAVAQVKQHAARVGKRSVPVVATSFMGEVGKRLCEEADVSWFDLSGNAHIVAPGLRILIEGKPNRFLRRGRPSSAFAPKSARIARHLLIEPQRAFRQQELARETGLDDGFTSRIVGRLERDGLVERDKAGAIRTRSPDLMLDATLVVTRRVVSDWFSASEAERAAVMELVERVKRDLDGATPRRDGCNVGFNADAGGGSPADRG